jgi:uncharacterized membrane protein YkvI
MHDGTPSGTSTWFQRFLLPGFAFKATVIGGGYATGRELAEFFLPCGPWGGIAAILMSMVIWSTVCVATFLLAHRNHTFDYRSFFRQLLGRGWLIFEITYVLLVMVVLSVFGAAAGAIGHAMFGLPLFVGTCALTIAIAGFVAFGTTSIERLFQYVSFLLYGVYILFAMLALTRFGPAIKQHFELTIPAHGWVVSGLTYAGYNVIGAVVILPVLRHLTRPRDAVIAGALAGPLAIVPALVFFVCMMAFYPRIGGETLPSDFMLRQLNMPVFHYLFQIMIFAALLESGAGFIHAINERISAVWELRRGMALSHSARFANAVAILFACVLVSDRFGLITLIAKGYRALSYIVLLVYVLPLLTYGIWCLRRLPGPNTSSR